MTNMQDIETIRLTHPMYQRYWCCTRTIGSKHSRNCPSVPTADGPLDGEDDIPVGVVDEVQ